MSLGIFGLILMGVLIAVAMDAKTRGRVIFVAVVGFMLGLSIAGSNGVLAHPAHSLVDGLRTGLTTLGHSLGGDQTPTPNPGTTPTGTGPSGSPSGGGR